MWRLLSWIRKILATLAGGPGVVVLGNPGLDPPTRDSRVFGIWFRVVVLGLLSILIFSWVGTEWPFWAAVAILAIALVPLVRLLLGRAG